MLTENLKKNRQKNLATRPSKQYCFKIKTHKSALNKVLWLMCRVVRKKRNGQNFEIRISVARKIETSNDIIAGNGTGRFI